MTATFSFRDLTLAQAEAEIVGAAIDHEHALLTALQVLPLDDFRSYRGADLRRIFYVLAGWYSKDTWDAPTNRDRLEHCFPTLPIDDYWCPSGTIPEYVRDLCQAVANSNRLADEAVAATRAWRDRNPLGGIDGRPVAKRPMPRGGVA